MQTESATPAPLAVALDGMNQGEALALARRLEGVVWGFKIDDLLLREGAALIPRLKHYGRVFCDPRLHDIPNTVAHEVALLAGSGADLITVHCSGGESMLRAARKACPEGCGLLGITVLTALPAADVAAVCAREIRAVVGELIVLARVAGLAGLVCSPWELELAAEVDPEHRLLRVTPGIRSGRWEARDDRLRVHAPAEAWRRGADLLVIGRPVTRAEDPVAACRHIAAERGE